MMILPWIIQIYRQHSIMKLSKRQVPLNSSSKKPTYFEKYRKELQKITNQIQIQNMKSSTLISLSRIERPSPQKQPEMRRSLIMREIESSNFMNDELMTPPLLAQDSQMPVISRTVTDAESYPTTRRISGNQFSIFPSPTVTSRKVSILMNTSSEKDQDDTPTSYRQQYGHGRRDSEMHYELESMSKQNQLLKARLQKQESELLQKNREIQELNVQLAENAEVDYMKSIVSYAEQIIRIEQQIRQMKRVLEEELDCLVTSKNQIYRQNTTYSDEIQILNEEIQRLRAQYDTFETQSPNKQLQKQQTRLEGDISKLQIQLEAAEKRNNSAQELEDISQGQFNRYKEAYIKRFIGRQIALAEDRIRYRGDHSRFQQQIDRKRVQLKQKKIQVLLRKKSLMQLYKVSEKLEKVIGECENQVKKLNIPDRKFTIFNNSTL